MHAVQEGPASQSYGLQVAQLAGVPTAVIQQAQQKLSELEQHEAGITAHQNSLTASALIEQKASVAAEVTQKSYQSDLFAPSHPALTLLKTLNPDEMTPRQALEALYALKNSEQ